jgi:hypothetical protein
MTNSPVALVDMTIGICKNSRTMHGIFVPLSFIDISSDQPKSSKSVSFVMMPGTRVAISVWVSHGSIALLLADVVFTCVQFTSFSCQFTIAVGF